MLYIKKTLGNSQIVITESRVYDNSIEKDAIIMFNNFLKEGVVTGCKYEDNVWYLYNESKRVKISFEMNEKIFKEECTFRNLGSYDDLVNAMKFYILYNLEFTTIASIRSIVNDIKKIFEITRFFRKDYRKELLKLKENSSLIQTFKNIIELVEFYPLEIDDEYFDLMNTLHEHFIVLKQEKNGLNQREIGNLENVFKFGDVLNDFWDNASLSEREKYFPIKLWWEITTIIPMRATEFTLIPYDCLINENGKKYIKILRSNLKGSRNKSVAHKISEDYSEYKLRINTTIYELIEQYKSYVDPYDFQNNFYYEGYDIVGRRSYLLSRRSYFKSLKEKQPLIQGSYKNLHNLEHFRLEQLDYLLEIFYKDVVQNKYHYKLLWKKSNKLTLEDDEMQIMGLMDTRHYAFINLVLNEVEPLIIKEISGHSSIESSYHYYNHVSKFIKCYTYSMAKKIAFTQNCKSNINIIEINNNISEAKMKFERIFEIETEEGLETNKGKCNSKQKNFEDCIRVNNNCELCDFGVIQINKSEDISKLIDKNNNLIEQEIESIKKLLKNSKKIKNLVEQQQMHINKIKAISNQNSILIGKHIL